MQTIEQRVKELKAEIEEQFSVEDLTGERVIATLEALERDGATIYWGCWDIGNQVRF